MSEIALAQIPSIFRWKGPKQGRTMFSAQAGRLTLTSARLVWEPVRGDVVDVPLSAVQSAELTGGKVFKNLTVGFGTQGGTEFVTFGTQQFGMPNAQAWADQIQQAAQAARGGPPAPAPGGSVGPAGRPGVDAASYAPFVAFAQAGRAPHLVSWRVVRTLDPAVVDPGTGRVEIWSDVVARGPIQYLHMAAGYLPDGTLRVLAGAEVMPEAHDSCYLGVFVDGMHHNLGAHEECRTAEGFAQRGVDVVLGVLDGQRRAASGDAPPAPPPASPPPAPALSHEEAVSILRELHDEAGTVPVEDVEEVRDFLTQAARACEAIDRETCAVVLLHAASAPTAPEPLGAAGREMLEAGIGSLAVVPLRAAVAHGATDASTLEALTVALDARDDLDGAAEVLRQHAEVRESSAVLTALWTHYAAMTGDLEAVRQTVGGMPYGGELDDYRLRALERLARADALAPAPTGDDQAGELLRWWDAVLQGTVLVHTSEVGVEDMGGRYAAVWDDVARMAEVLAGLDAAVAAAECPAPDRVVAAPDRDSQILGWVLATRYGIGAPVSLTDPSWLEAPTSGTTLVTGYTWAGVLDQTLTARLRSDPSTVLFAYSLEWTRYHRLVPDVVGFEAQTVVPPWGERMKVDRMPGELAEGERPALTIIPADDREPALVGADIAAQVAAVTAVPDVGSVTRLVDRLRGEGAPAGILGDPRHMWFPGGPVRSNRF